MRLWDINHNSVRLLLIIAADLLLLEGLGRREMLQANRDTDDEIQDYKGLAHPFNTKLIYWDKNEHFIERLI